jgi:FMN reductase
MTDISQRDARIVVVSAGVSDPSSSRLLADRITGRSLELLRESGTQASASVVELAPLAVDIARATVSGFPSEQLRAAIERIADADAIIASTPIYKAGISGLFKAFVDVLDNDLLVAKPVLLAATAGTSRHALVIDDQMRPLFGYMRALVLPTTVFAGTEDWAASELGERIDRAATELAVIVEADDEPVNLFEDDKTVGSGETDNDGDGQLRVGHSRQAGAHWFEPSTATLRKPANAGFLVGRVFPCAERLRAVTTKWHARSASERAGYTRRLGVHSSTRSRAAPSGGPT